MKKRNQLPAALLAVLGLGAGLLIWRGVERMRRAYAPEPEPLAKTAGQPVAPAPDASREPRGERDGISDADIRRIADLVASLDRHDARIGEAVLVFTSAEAYQRFLERAAGSGLLVLGQSGRLLAVRVRFDSPYDLQQELLLHAGDHAGTTANFIMAPPLPPSAEERAQLQLIPLGNTLLSFLGVAADTSAWGRGMTIAIIDSGVASDSTFGTGRLRALDVGLGIVPLDGHGTAVASLAAGELPNAQGVAPAASLLSIRVIGNDGLSDVFTVADAIVAAVDAGADIINLSLGSYQTSTVLTSAIDYAAQHGVVLVAAVGNDQVAQITWPAADSRVVAVGAVDALSQQATFSNSGPELDLTAPGYGVQAAWTDGERVYFSGTSASAPIVSGAIAALVSQNLGMTAVEAVSVLENYASEAGPVGADVDYGSGVLNLGWALARNDYARVDTAVASHTYDATADTVSVVVENRSARSLTGLNLLIDVNGTTSNQLINWIEAGGTETIAVPLPTSGSSLSDTRTIVLQTQLLNPVGILDAVPTNNTRASEISLPAP